MRSKSKVLVSMGVIWTRKALIKDKLKFQFALALITNRRAATC